MSTTEPSPEALSRFLSPERLRTYLDAVDGDHDDALALYEWNLLAGGSSTRSTGLVEVVVRNAMDAALQAWADRQHGGTDWLDVVVAPRRGAGPLLDRHGRDDVRKARRRAERGGRSYTHGHVVAELSPGFWRYLPAKRYLTSLWVPALRHAFPQASPDVRRARADVEKRLEDLLFLRNRAAHHEPLFRRDLVEDRRRALELLGWVDPEAERWLRRVGDLHVVHAVRPDLT